MATGAGLGGLASALLPLIGIATILVARRRRKRMADEPADEAFEARQVATREAERRMAAYLASRQADSYEAGQGEKEQETRR